MPALTYQGAPIAGWIYDTSGGKTGDLMAFRPAIYYTGAVALFSCIFLLPLRWMANKSLLAKA